MYLEPNFPEKTPVLNESLEKLGISRADLWHFATLVGLNDFLVISRASCSDRYWEMHATCDDFPCYVAPLDNILKMFKTGRKDCEADPKFGPYHKYLTVSKESHPSSDSAIETTTEYFLDKIKLQPRESLALMGVHTIGQISH